MNKILYIVVPCYNEQEVLPITSKIFIEKIESLYYADKISSQSRILFVNDGSKDNTWEIIKELSAKCEYVEGISLSRNRGHQNALLAGLMYAKDFADVTISIDCDGQDDINAMDEMIDAYLDGCDVVYGVRKNRASDTYFKRATAEFFYKIMKAFGAEIVFNHADYRLMSKKALEHLSSFEEVNIFLRGLVPLVGFKSTSVYYDRAERMAGKSKYPLRKMISLAINGITSLSTKPIRIVTVMGLIFSLLGFAGVIWAIVMSALDRVIDGWTSTVCIVSLFGGIQLLSIGIIGEYVGKIYLETKKRPKFIISEETKNDKYFNI